MTTTHRISTGVALALALAASAAPAGARPFDLNANGSYVPARSTSTQTASQPAGIPPILAVPNAWKRAALQQAQPQDRLATTPATMVRVPAPGGGFDWGDAGIGAAGALGLALIGVGGAFAISQQRRGHQSRRSAVITS